MWTRLMLGVPLRDATGGFNAFRAATLRGIGLDNIASAGYCFQVDLTWRALKAGFTVIEVPITFVEREYGDSKMSQKIVVEALIRDHVVGCCSPDQPAPGVGGTKESGELVKLRRGWPLMIFVILLVAIPTFEVWLLVQVGNTIGLLPTLVILFAEAVIGAWLMRREGGRAWQALMAAFTTGKVPTGELADAALILVGGVLLMLPGFATDIIGFVFLLPITRPLARRMVAFFVARRVRRMNGLMTAGGATVIRGETVESSGPAEGPVVIVGEISDGPQK